jgi:hypothetical protein
MVKFEATITILQGCNLRSHGQARGTSEIGWQSRDDLCSIVQQDHERSVEMAFLFLTMHDSGSAITGLDCNAEQSVEVEVHLSCFPLFAAPIQPATLSVRVGIERFFCVSNDLSQGVEGQTWLEAFAVRLRCEATEMSCKDRCSERHIR